MRLLLDTHLILWWQGTPEQVPTLVLEMVLNSNNMAYISRASIWELAIKVNRGRLKLDLARFCKRIVADGFSWLPIETEHVLTVVALPTFDDHKDPFDRLLVAQSISEPLILLTADKKLARYGSTIRVV